MSILHRPAASAEMDAPNITQYYKCTFLAQLKTWWNPTQHLPWLQIESATSMDNLKLSLGATWL